MILRKNVSNHWFNKAIIAEYIEQLNQFIIIQSPIETRFVLKEGKNFEIVIPYLENKIYFYSSRYQNDSCKSSVNLNEFQSLEYIKLYIKTILNIIKLKKRLDISFLM